MAAANTSKNEILGVSTNQKSYLASALCRMQDFTDIYINPEETISMDAESAHLQSDLNSETPNKYPNAPHSSPIDSQSDPDSNVFNEALVKCLNELPVILLSLEERIKDGSSEMSDFDAEDSSRGYFKASPSTESDECKEFQYHYEDARKSFSLQAMTVTASSNLAEDGKDISTEHSATNANHQPEKFNFLRVDSLGDFGTGFNRRNTLSDDTSIIANFDSDVSDISLEDVESGSSDGNLSCSSRGRIEFEALALDSAFHPSTVKLCQNWRTRGRNKRALSLDEMIPSKLLHSTDFSTTPFELTL